MVFEDKTIAGDVLILKRAPFEAVPMTLDFSSVATVDAFGNKIVKAGTPIGATGVVDNTATVKGILLYDVIEARPIGSILKKGYIDTTKAQTHSGVTIASAAKGALPMVIFE